MEKKLKKKGNAMTHSYQEVFKNCGGLPLMTQATVLLFTSVTTRAEKIANENCTKIKA